MPCSFPYKRLSHPFPVLGLDLQQRVDAIAATAACSSSSAAALPPLQWETDQRMSIAVDRDGVWNAVAFWFEVHHLSPFPPPCPKLNPFLGTGVPLVYPGPLTTHAYQRRLSFLSELYHHADVSCVHVQAEARRITELDKCLQEVIVLLLLYGGYLYTCRSIPCH